MPRSTNFENIELLVQKTVDYMFENNLENIEGGFRGESHFKTISERYGVKNESASVNLYTKWNRNDGQFKTRVLENLLALRNGKTVIEKKKLHVFFDKHEWDDLQDFISKTLRPRFLASVNQLFTEKFHVKGIKCSFKMSYNNSFSSSKKVIPGHNFWGGKVKCIYCSNELKGFVKIKPIKNDGIDFVFDWNGKQCSAIGPLPKRQLKDEERVLVQNEIRAKGVKNYIAENHCFSNYKNSIFRQYILMILFLKEKDNNEIAYENGRKLKSLFYHRFQLSNEMRIESDATKLFFDQYLIKYKNEEHGFIHDIVSNPIGFLMFSTIQVKMWALIEKINPVWYFDATGNVMAKYRGQNNTLLYSLVAHDCENSKLVPVADFVSSQNDNITIGLRLSKILLEAKGYSYFKKPSIIVSDFSWANIKGCMFAFNQMEIMHYLVLCYSILVKKEQIDLQSTGKTVIYLCSTHFLKNIIDSTDKELKNVKLNKYLIRKSFIFCFSILQTSTKFEEFCDLLAAIKNIFNRPIKDTIFIESMVKVNAKLIDRSGDWFNNVCDTIKKGKDITIEKDIFLFQSNGGEVNYSKDSPFTSFFEKFLEESKDMETESEYEANIYYYPNLFEIIKKRLHLVPFWSGFMINNILPGKSRLSNNPVESWFRFFKNSIICTNKRLKGQRLLFSNELATPYYFYLLHLFETMYEDKFNVNFKWKKTCSFKDKDKENWSTQNYRKTDAKYFTKNYRLDYFENLKFKKNIDQKIFDHNVFGNFFFDIYSDPFSESFKSDQLKVGSIFDSLEKPVKEIKKESIIQDEINEKQTFVVRRDLYFYKLGEFFVRCGDVEDLLKEGWLNDTILETYGNSLVKKSKKKILCINSFYATSMFENDFERHKDVKYDNFSAVYGFINENGNHWTLMYIDLKESHFYYLDSFKNYEILDDQGVATDKRLVFFEKWRKFCSITKTLKLRQWKLMSPMHAFQKDSINCGIFACNFLDALINGKHLNFDSDGGSLELIRVKMNQTFKNSTENNFCSICSFTLKDIHFIKSEKCFHKYHLKCLEEFNYIREPFKCPQCS